MVNVTVSLREDEIQKIGALTGKYGLKRHEVIKLALRFFLFPEQRQNIPLDGKSVHVYDAVGLTLHGAENNIVVTE